MRNLPEDLQAYAFHFSVITAIMPSKDVFLVDIAKGFYAAAEFGSTICI